MAQDSRVREPGRYLLYTAGHFTGARIVDSHWCRVSLSHRSHEHVDVPVSDLDFSRFEAVMRIVPGKSTRHYGMDYLGGAVSGQQILSCSGTVLPLTGYTSSKVRVYIVI